MCKKFKRKFILFLIIISTIAVIFALPTSAVEDYSSFFENYKYNLPSNPMPEDFDVSMPLTTEFNDISDTNQKKYDTNKKEYEINQADFNIEINNDGSAYITETWKVNYIGSYSRFYKDICWGSLNSDDYFKSINNLSVSIDGVPCSPTKDVDARPEYTFSTESGDRGCTVSCYKSSINTTREYTISYQLKDIIKCVDNDYYLFVYRLIGANFDKKVYNITVNITAPNGCKLSERFVSNGKCTSLSDNCFQITSSGYKGQYKVRMRIDGGKIPGAINITNDDINEFDDNDINFAKLMIILIASAVILPWLISFCYHLIIVLHVRKHPEALDKKVEYWRTDLNPLEFVALATHWRKYSIIAAALAYYISTNLIKYNESDNSIYLSDSLAIYDNSFKNFFAQIKALTEDDPSYEKYGQNIFILDDLVRILQENPRYCKAISEQYHNAIVSISSKKLDSKKLKKIMKDGSFIIQTINSYFKKQTVTFSDVVNSRGNYLHLMELTVNGQSSKVVNNTSPQQNELAVLLRYLCIYTTPYTDNKSSNSNGSSCSSCSSCSGCGGGGAD